MRKTRISEFTGKDAILLVIALYTVKSVYIGFSEAVHPRIRRWGANMEEKTRIRKVEDALRKSSERR